MLTILTSESFTWDQLPQIPAGKRTQYLLLTNDGGYKYGYDTGDGSGAKQSGNSANQVEGRYFYQDPLGQNVDVRYTAGVQGFVPQETRMGKGKYGNLYVVRNITNKMVAAFVPVPSFSFVPSLDQPDTGDASYSFAIDTDTYKRAEVSDVSGNVRGTYSYVNDAGTHDLNYRAGKNIGFVAESGSLAKPNGLSGKAVTLNQPPEGSVDQTGSDVSYQTGGTTELSVDNTLVTDQTIQPTTSSSDQSYAFSYSTKNQARQESSDTSGNVQGSYSYRDDAGVHDLSYQAADNTGFVVTGGNLAPPTSYISGSPRIVTPDVPEAPSFVVAPPYNPYPGGYPGYPVYQPQFPYDPNLIAGQGPDPDDESPGDTVVIEAAKSLGSQPLYSWSFNTKDYKRQESGDAKGDVKGAFWYKNAAGNNDLSFVAGSETGFRPTGGSLSVPPGLTAEQLRTTRGVVPILLLPGPIMRSLRGLDVKNFLPPGRNVFAAKP